jgi:hypothetical protein
MSEKIPVQLLLAFLLVGSVSSVAQKPPLKSTIKQEVESKMENNFHHPPDEAKTYVFWQWMNGNITKAGITADLEAMKRVGVGGVEVFQVTNTIPKGPVAFLSSEWIGLIHFAIAEAARLGLSFTILNCAGWSNSGGPWIKPEQSMQMLAWTDLRISGPQHYSEVLPQAQFEERIYSTDIDPGYRRGSKPLSDVGSRFYRDIAILAFPTPVNEPEMRNLRLPLINENLFLDEKAETAKFLATDRSKVINLTGNILDDGRLIWDVPSGNWTILRLGYTPTGQFNHPAPEGGVGLECDKFSRTALQTVWNNLAQVIIKDAGSMAGPTLRSVLIDSWEVGNQHWSQGYKQEFITRRGYDPTPWLPVLSGRIIETRELTDRFLWDLRRTNEDLIADNYFAELTRLCHSQGLRSAAEAYGGPFDEVQASGTLDIPMGEFWAGNPDQPVSSEKAMSNRLSASAAHGYGKPIVAAEAFTARPADGKWSNDPYSLKLRGDWAFCQGINRFVIHRYAHQPWIDVKPGMTMGPYGINFERTNTWWEQSRQWMAYVARCQYMLQQGRFVADVAYFPGDQAPTNTIHDNGLALNGYDFDFLSADLLLQLQYVDGYLTLPGGMRYKVLVVGGDGRLRRELVEKIRELSLAGAPITCPRPLESPSLKDYPDGDARIRAIASELWDSKHIFTCDASALLSKTSVLPDVEAPLEYIHRRAGDFDIYFLANPSRKAIDCRVLFRIGGRRAELWDPDSGVINNITVAQEQKDGRTLIPVHLDPAGSVFVVFRYGKQPGQIVDITENGKSIIPQDTVSDSPSGLNQGVRGTRVTLAGQADRHPEAIVWVAGTYTIHHADGSRQDMNVAQIPPPIKVSGSWQVQFPPRLGAPAEVTFDSLISWTDHSIAGVRYFSGTASYQKSFDLPATFTSEGSRLVLNLGEVRNIAEVTLNGVKLGILWRPPFSVEITSAAKTGTNRLNVSVTNLWVNRLIGDEQEPQDCEWGPGEHGIALKEWPEWFQAGKPRPSSGRIAFTTFRFYEKDSPLIRSGLLGPVTIQKAVAVKLK